MAKRIVNVELRGTGGAQVASELGKAGKASNDFVVNIKKIGNAFGELGSFWGDLISNITKGGIWGIMNAVVQGAVSLFSKWMNSAKEAAEAAAKATKDSLDKQQSYIDNFMSALKKVSDTENQWLSHGLSLTKQRIDATNNLTKATLELEKAEARMRGDKEAMADADRKIAEADITSQRERLQAEITNAELRKRNADKALAGARRGVESERKHIRQIDKEIREGSRKAIADMGVFDDEREVSREYHKSKAYTDLVDAKKAARDKLGAYEGDIRRFIQDADKAQSDILSAQKALEALDKTEQARKINAQQDEIEKEEEARKKEAEDIKKFNAEKERLEKKIADERKKLEREVAAEREKRERELHQKRMEDLRKEIAAQKEAAAPLRSVAAAAQSEFDKAFAMYRDPSRAAAEIGEEKDYRSDLDRLHRDARRYGAKWRIDELSSLMAAGDTRGVSDTLAEWRKNKGFTPEVEAMVRASAAENAKTTVEDELRKIETNTAGLDKKLDELLSMK